MKKTLNHPNQAIKLASKCSFILRLWRANPSEEPEWHASLEEPETGERIGFACLEQLFAFLIYLTELKNEMTVGGYK